MRNWKNWLFPILSALTVAALALLPLRLSVMEDGKLTGTVHAEPLSEDSNFPFKPPDLPGRIWLLVQWQEMPDNLTIMSQELEGAERDREIARLREALEDLGTLLPPETAALLMEFDGDSWDWGRLYLRDQTDLSSASFIVSSTYDKYRRVSFYAVLDGESGQFLNFHFRCFDGVPCDASSLELGRTVLERLELNYDQTEGYDSYAYFRLKDGKSEFRMETSERELSFGFQLDWSAVDVETAEAYGYPAASSTDADLMQKS